MAPEGLEFAIPLRLERSPLLPCPSVILVGRAMGSVVMPVAVVDDEQPVRSGLTLILGAAPDIEAVACCDGIDAVDRVRELRPDVLLLDIRMPEADGLTVLRQVGALTASPAVAMLTTFDADRAVAEAARARHRTQDGHQKDGEPHRHGVSSRTRSSRQAPSTAPGSRSGSLCTRNDARDDTYPKQSRAVLEARP